MDLTDGPAGCTIGPDPVDLADSSAPAVRPDPVDPTDGPAGCTIRPDPRTRWTLPTARRDAIRTLQLERAAGIILLVFVVVYAIERLSSWVRSQLI